MSICIVIGIGKNQNQVEEWGSRKTSIQQQAELFDAKTILQEHLSGT